MHRGSGLVALPEDTTGQLRPAFITLVCAVAVVLLIACSNVANLLLVRFSGLKREIAMRSQWRSAHRAAGFARCLRRAGTSSLGPLDRAWDSAVDPIP